MARTNRDRIPDLSGLPDLTGLHNHRSRSWPSAGNHAWTPARATVEQSLPETAPESREGWGDRNRIAIEGSHPLSLGRRGLG